MKKKLFAPLILLSFSVLLGSPLPSPAAAADGPTQLDSLEVLGMIRTPTCGVITSSTPLDTPIVNARGCGPVLAPDGHQLTLGEFKAAQGTVRIKCINAGTHTVIHFSGLIPRGTYTIWLFLWGTSPPMGMPLAVGALGNSSPDDPIANSFIASAAGEGEISRINAEGFLSANGGPVPACWLGAFPEVHVALVYHIDGQSHGPVPGPVNTWVAQSFFRVLP